MLNVQDTNVEKAVNQFSTQIKSLMQGNVIDIRLFGSVVKGKSTQESDIDILILLKKKNYSLQKLVYDVAFDVSLEYDVVISPILKSLQEYNSSLFQQTLFYKNIQKDGVSL